MKKCQHESRDDYGHPSVDSTNRHSLDCLFRKHGYRIHSRKKKQQAVWMKDGQLFKAEEVIQQIPGGEIKDAQMIQDFYYDSAST